MEISNVQALMMLKNAHISYLCRVCNMSDKAAIELATDTRHKLYDIKGISHAIWSYTRYTGGKSKNENKGSVITVAISYKALNIIVDVCKESTENIAPDNAETIYFTVNSFGDFLQKWHELILKETPAIRPQT